MAQTLTTRFQTIFQTGREWLFTGNNALIFTTAYFLISTLLVYFNPLSLPAFLLFMFSAYLIYALPMKGGVKASLGILMALVFVPVIGARNIFYLEVIFQIALFSALALGLHIVVGFAGLLNMGYLAFYAVGAYLWAIFGSQQLFLLHAIPGSEPPTSNFFL